MKKTKKGNISVETRDIGSVEGYLHKSISSIIMLFQSLIRLYGLFLRSSVKIYNHCRRYVIHICSKYCFHPISLILLPLTSRFSVLAFSAYSSTFRCTVGSNDPRIRAARRAALTLLLIPTVATGTPNNSLSASKKTKTREVRESFGSWTYLAASGQCCTSYQHHPKHFLSRAHQ
jgi:hypothetical protein